MLTKSIRLTDEEANELDEVVRLSGEVEASILKRAALRGLREDRLERAVLLYLRGASTSEAAIFARVPRARFIDLLVDKGISDDLRGSVSFKEFKFSPGGLVANDTVAIEKDDGCRHRDCRQAHV